MPSNMQKGMKIKQGEKADFTHYEQESPKVSQKMEALRKAAPELLGDQPIGNGKKKEKK